MLRVSLEDIYLGLTEGAGQRDDNGSEAAVGAAGRGAGEHDRAAGQGSFRGVSDLPLVARQVRFEQLSFWLNPIGAVLTIGFSVVFIVIFLSTSGHSTVGYLAHINLGEYYLPAFAAYGIMSACFNILAISLVNRREMGLLKRLRLSPLPTWMLLAAIFINSMIIAVIQIVLMLLVGRIRLRRARSARHRRLRPRRRGGHAQLHGTRRGGQHVGAQRRCGGACREPRVLHTGGALGAVLPGRSQALAWRPSPTSSPSAT